MSLIEIVAVIFSLLCIWLAMKKHILNWPAGIIGVTAYAILFWEVKLYADLLLQVFFFVQGIYGWYNWHRNTTQEKTISTSYLGNPERIIYLTLILVFASAWAFLLIRYTDASTPYVDAMAATISLAANFLMAQKKIENWILWIAADIIYIALFSYKELYLSSGIYILFLILAINGFITWNNQKSTEKGLY